MTTRAEELSRLDRGDGCLARAADDEPLFILRAQDRFFVPVLLVWRRSCARRS
jgi:hypothetical protein